MRVPGRRPLVAKPILSVAGLAGSAGQGIAELSQRGSTTSPGCGNGDDLFLPGSVYLDHSVGENQRWMVKRRTLRPYAFIRQCFQEGNNRCLFSVTKACACKVWINVGGREVSGPAVAIHQLCQRTLPAVR